MAVPGKRATRYLARFITQGNGFGAMYLNQTRQNRCHQNAMIRQSGFALADQGCIPGVSTRVCVVA
jgi:hypothetical protein